MFANALDFLIRNIAEFFILVLLTRFYLQASRVSFKHPVGQFVLALTNWIVLPVRRVVPPVRNLDTASLLLAWACAFLMHLILLAITPWPFIFGSPLSIIALMLAAVLELFKMSLYLLFAATIGQALMSWISPYNPMMPVLEGITGPFLRPLRRMIPTVGGIDITPWILILIIQLLLSVVVASLEPYILQNVRIAT
ncbi:MULTISPECIES: YggT family protein [Silvimonas]|uniref:YggT family protein n=2 Tax=Silvimonas TaxID=300264 RepID=A0ABQ2PC33_9NEIS|nr:MULTISPECIES: YggT family protein [Silvimonas]GGP22824.1 YggT family protein [Silvimonas iriomotensis]GGP27270.1 YggT family protein [Silvimonas amylolytica]